jgi:hypothetical protein
LTGVTILANSSCTISVDVAAAAVNCYTNVSGSITSDQGTGNSASATLCAIAEGPPPFPVQPLLITQVFSPSVILGTPISDIATLSGGFNPTGTITFSLYGPNDATCTGAPIFTSPVPVTTGNGNYGSGSFTPTIAGTYRWVVNYGGDSNNEPTINGCNALNETVVVTHPGPPVPTLSKWGMIIFMVLVGLISIYYLRRQKAKA